MRATKSYPQVYPQVWIKVGDNHLSVVAPSLRLALVAGDPSGGNTAQVVVRVRVNPSEHTREVLPVQYLRLVLAPNNLTFGGSRGFCEPYCRGNVGHCLAFLVGVPC